MKKAANKNTDKVSIIKLFSYGVGIFCVLLILGCLIFSITNPNDALVQKIKFNISYLKYEAFVNYDFLHIKARIKKGMSCKQVSSILNTMPDVSPLGPQITEEDLIRKHYIGEECERFPVKENTSFDKSTEINYCVGNPVYKITVYYNSRGNVNRVLKSGFCSACD
jgi:hypothetical protein